MPCSSVCICSFQTKNENVAVKGMFFCFCENSNNNNNHLVFSFHFNNFISFHSHSHSISVFLFLCLPSHIHSSFYFSSYSYQQPLPALNSLLIFVVYHSIILWNFLFRNTITKERNKFGKKNSIRSFKKRSNVHIDVCPSHAERKFKNVSLFFRQQ